MTQFQRADEERRRKESTPDENRIPRGINLLIVLDNHAILPGGPFGGQQGLLLVQRVTWAFRDSPFTGEIPQLFRKREKGIERRPILVGKITSFQLFVTFLFGVCLGKEEILILDLM
ncbi:hypothetical protein MLD38_003718 [Melastoma candidum]|uniref:Uncharacterized protein n=1 Tax=Melastoma candidum TaxID=119954 RepID=A0ACB9S368_9MYRT|nr:hypothetical protein MLD38_003718 [Melastoma candidum]